MSEKRHPKSIVNTANRKVYRERAILAYGGCCGKCGFSDNRALQFDHIKSNGKEDRKRSCQPCYYLEIIASPPGVFQLLCCNCNWIKRYESKEMSDVGNKTSNFMTIYWQEVRAGKRPAPVHKKL